MAATPSICFAHAAYRLGEEFARRGPGWPYVEVRNLDALRAALAEVDVLVVSGLWRDELIEAAPRLRFVQSISAGTDQFSKPLLTARGIRLASAQGANERAVAEHAIALLLSLTRHLGRARDDQARRHWSGMIGDPSHRQVELSGRTMVVVGLGRIGTRIARLAKAFDMRVVGVKRNAIPAPDVADEIFTPDRLIEVLRGADAVVLACPLTPDTDRLIRAEHFEAMKPSCVLINVARGRVIDEGALISALEKGGIAGAALDSTVEEPLPASSPLWGMSNVTLTPHSAGETARYEENVIDVLLENLALLKTGNPLRNQVA